MSKQNTKGEVIRLTSEGPSPPVLLEQAIAAGNTELARDLMGLMRDWRQWQAEEDEQRRRLEYNEALAEATLILPDSIKKDENYKVDKSGKVIAFESLPAVLKEVNAAFKPCKLRVRFPSGVRVENSQNIVKVATKIQHTNGYAEQSDPMELVAFSMSPAMNPVQAVGSTLTYLARYSLRSFIGLAAAKDDDAQSVDPPADPPITAEQVEELKRLMAEVKPATTRRGKPVSFEDYEKVVCASFEVETLAEITQSEFADRKATLEAKRNRANG